MARFCNLCAISIILLLMVQQSFTFKGKKEFKKSKDMKGRVTYLDSFPENGKFGQTTHHYAHQQNSQRPNRSVRDAKMKVALEDPTNEKVQRNHIKVKKLHKPQMDEIIISKGIEATCGKKYDCGNTEKQRRRVSVLAVDEIIGKGKNENKVKASKAKRSNSEDAENQREPTSEDVEYKVCSRINQKEKKFPAYLVYEDSVSDVLLNEYENKYSSKALRHLPSKFVIESENESDSEKGTAYNYMELSDDAFDESSSYPGLNETEEEFEEDFL